MDDMDTYYYIGGALLLFVFAWIVMRPNAAQTDDTTQEWEYYDDEEEAEARAPALPYYKPGFAYTWDQVLDLVWALGYSQDEAHKMWRGNYAYLYRAGIRAEFDGTLMGTDKHGEPLFMCHCFEETDTEFADRWQRQPSAADVKKAVWR